MFLEKDGQRFLKLRAIFFVAMGNEKTITQYACESSLDTLSFALNPCL